MNSFKNHNLTFALLITISLFLSVFAGCNSRKNAELLNSKLRSAASEGNVNKVEYYLNQGADINTEDENGKTALYYAIANKKWDAARYLVERRTTVKPVKNEKKDFYGEMLMHEFAVREDWKTVQLLIEMGVNVNSKFEYNYRDATVLCYAAQSGNLEMVKWLVEHDADIYEDEYILRYAAQSGNLELVQWLVENGLDVNDDNDVLCYAAQSGNLEMVKWLVEKGLDVNYELYGKSVLHYAVESGNLELVKWLVENGADVKKIIDNSDVFDAAVCSGNQELVQWLVENGADVKKNIDNYGVLDSAVRSGNPGLVKYLAENGANFKDKYLHYGLESALSNGNLEMVQCLIDLDVDVIQEINNSRYIVIGHEVLFHWLVEHGANFNETNSYLFEFVKDGNLENVKWLINHGADVNAKDKNKKTVLYYAIKNWDLNMVKILVEHGADVNSDVYTAVEEGNLEIVQFLVEHGADVNSGVNIAAAKGNLEIVQFLVEHGANPRSQAWFIPYWFELWYFETCSDYSILSYLMFHDIIFVTITSFLLLVLISSIYVLIKKRYKSSLSSDAKSKA